MPRSLSRVLLLLLLLLPAGLLRAEKVADLPIPNRYVNDFAGALSPEEKQSLEALCVQLHQKANAEFAVVTIKTLDDDQSIEEFTGALEEKWKFGKKGEDRSAIYVLVTESRKVRIEVGYGLEGVLNDAKVGRILDDALPAARQDDWDHATGTAVQEVAQAIAADSHVTLTPAFPATHQYHWQGQQGYARSRNQGHLGLGQVILGGIFVLVLLILVLTGHAGWAWMLLWSVMGGGGGGGGRDDDRGGGGFGGIGGGSSGGGGASRDF
jgi:uncharacterized protein